MARFLDRLALAACTLLCLVSTAAAGINSWTQVGPEGGDITDLVITTTTPSLTYALTPKALYRSSDTGRSWTHVWSPRGTALDFAVHPTQTNRVFVIVSFELLASSDGGATQVAITPSAATGRIRKVEISQDGALVYATDGRIVYRSSDFGATWTTGATIPAPAEDSIQSFKVDPTNANRLLARLVGGGLLITRDAGDHWTSLASPPLHYVNEIAFSHSGTRIWAAGNELWQTTDEGANWTRSALTQAVSALAFHPSDPSAMYAQVGSSIYRSTDGGAQWTRGNGTYSLGTVGAFAFDPSAAERMLMASWNGVWVSTDGGANWSSSNRGIVATTTEHITSTTNRTYFAARGQIYSLEPGATTAVMLDHSALGQALSFDQSDLLYSLHADRMQTGDRLFVNEGSHLARSTDSGQTWIRLVDPVLGNDVAVRALAVAPDHPNVVLAATSNGVLHSIDGGDHWNATAGIPVDTWMYTLTFARDGVAFAAGGPQLYRSTDAGLSWSRVELPMTTQESIWNVVVQGDTTYLGAGTSAYRSTDNGVSWTRLPLSHGGWLAADATGLYIGGPVLERSVDRGDTWSGIVVPESTGATGLQLDPTLPGRLLYSTQSGGIYTYTVANDLVVTAVAQPPAAPGTGVRTDIWFTVTNRGTHAVSSGARLSINVADGRALFENSNCTVNAASRSQASCTVAAIPPGQSRSVRIESSFETAGPIGITVSVAGNETELNAADNTFTGSWSYTAPANSSGGNGGGGGAFSWWMLFALAGIAAEARRAQRARPA